MITSIVNWFTVTSNKWAADGGNFPAFMAGFVVLCIAIAAEFAYRAKHNKSLFFG